MKELDLEKIRAQMTSQMRRGVLELCILSIVSDKEAYTTDIIEQLKSSQLIVKDGTLYPLLSRLKEQKLVQYNWRESSKGPPRKYYSITESGRQFLGALMETWNSLVNAVNHSTQNISNNE